MCACAASRAARVCYLSEEEVGMAAKQEQAGAEVVFVELVVMRDIIMMMVLAACSFADILGVMLYL